MPDYMIPHSGGLLDLIRNAIQVKGFNMNIKPGNHVFRDRIKTDIDDVLQEFIGEPSNEETYNKVREAIEKTLSKYMANTTFKFDDFVFNRDGEVEFTLDIKEQAKTYADAIADELDDIGSFIATM